MCIHKKTWEKILKDFADAVHDKKYKRTDYRTKWCKIAKPTKSVCIEVQEHDISILIDNETKVIFNINDGTLGEFLYDTYYSKEEKSMPTHKDEIASTLDSLNISSNAYNITTADCTITLSDIAKVCDGLQSTGTSSTTTTTNPWTHFNTNSIAVVDSCARINIPNYPTFCDVENMIDKKLKEKEKNKENEKMKGFNFDFGPCTGDQVRMSMYGLAVRNAAGTYVSYNPKSGEIVDVDVLNFDGAKFMYKIPVAIKDIREGQVIIHNKTPMFVIAINENGTINVVDIRAGEDKTIYPQKSPFGFNFITRVISLSDSIFKPASNDNPFGNVLPFMMLSGDNKDFDIKDMLMFSMATGNSDFTGNINPMMLMLMMDNGKNDKSDWLMPFMLMNSGMMDHTYQCVKPGVDVGQN